MTVHDVMTSAVLVHCGFGGLLAVFSLPLALRRVPMNRFYGVRLPESFSSQACWLDINAYGGRLFFVYGVVLVAFGILARGLAPPRDSLWSPVFTVGPLVVALGLLPFVRSYARRRVREGPDRE